MVDDADHDFTGVMPNQLSPLLAAVADKDHAWTSEGMKRDPRWSRGNDMDPDPTQDEAISDPPLIRNNKEPVIFPDPALQSLEKASQNRHACNSNKSCSPLCSDDGDATTTTETSSDVDHPCSCNGSASCADDEGTTTTSETSSDVEHTGREDPMCTMKLAVQASRDFQIATKIALGNLSKKRVYTYRKRRESKNKKQVIARPHHAYVLYNMSTGANMISNLSCLHLDSLTCDIDVTLHNKT